MKYFVMFFVLVFMSLPTLAQLLIAPTRVIVDADSPITEKFIVENTSDKPIRVEIKPIYRPLKSNHSRRLDEDIESTEDLSEFLQVSPPVIRELKPNQRRVVRLRTQRLPANKPDGEYRAYLWFAPTVLSALGEQGIEPVTGSAFELDFIINSYIPIYAQRGDTVENIDIQCRNGELKLKNKSAYQFSAMLTADDHEEKLVILRQTEMDKSFAKETKIKVNQGERLIHECTL